MYKWIHPERCKLDSAPPYCNYRYPAHPTKREGVHKSIKRKIRTSTGTNNESSWALAEDSPQWLSHALATGARVWKSHVSKWDIATFYIDARWCIRNIFSNIRAFPQTLETTQILLKSSLSIHALWGTLVWPGILSNSRYFGTFLHATQKSCKYDLACRDHKFYTCNP